MIIQRIKPLLGFRSLRLNSLRYRHFTEKITKKDSLRKAEFNSFGVKNKQWAKVDKWYHRTFVIGTVVAFCSAVLLYKKEQSSNRFVDDETMEVDEEKIKQLQAVVKRTQQQRQISPSNSS